MNIFRTIVELFVLYLLYKLIFDFIIPVYQTTKQVRKKVGEMQQKVDEHVKQQQSNTFTTTEKAAPPKAAREDYIEFEEVKQDP